MSIFALVDCNNFYASCERVFNPKLINQPIVILSNNDGCIVARSNEAKSLGIPMAAPFFKWKEFCEKNNIYVFSSNYELYADMSARVMSILEGYCPNLEIYSIDEAFIKLNILDLKNIKDFFYLIMQKILRSTGIPVSVGIATTKTLAKLANHVAKNNMKGGVFDLRCPDLLQNILKKTQASELWGIGKKLTESLNKFGITTADELYNSNIPLMRKRFGINIARIVEELHGIQCHNVELNKQKKQIISSRSFGKTISSYEELEEAVANYAATACRKLRKQHSLAAAVHVFIYNKSVNRKPVSSTITLTEGISTYTGIIVSAKKCLKHIYKKGVKYKKAGVMLSEITSAKSKQYKFLVQENNKLNKLSNTVDLINKKMKKNVVIFCAEQINKPWKTKRELRSQSFTTLWNEIPTVYCK